MLHECYEDMEIDTDELIEELRADPFYLNKPNQTSAPSFGSLNNYAEITQAFGGDKNGFITTWELKKEPPPPAPANKFGTPGFYKSLFAQTSADTDPNSKIIVSKSVLKELSQEERNKTLWDNF